MEYFSTPNSEYNNLSPNALGLKIPVPISAQIFASRVNGSHCYCWLLMSPHASVIIPFITRRRYVKTGKKYVRGYHFNPWEWNHLPSWLFLVRFASSERQEVLSRKESILSSRYWPVLDEPPWLQKLTVSRNKSSQGPFHSLTGSFPLSRGKTRIFQRGTFF